MEWKLQLTREGKTQGPVWQEEEDEKGRKREKSTGGEP